MNLSIPLRSEYVLILILCCLLHTLIFFFPVPVYYIPDLALILYLLYKFRDLNQALSPIFFIGLILLLGYYFLSPEPPETEFKNNYLVSLKPFFYLCVLAAYLKNVPQIDLKKWFRIILWIYPLILLWNLFLVHLDENANLQHLMTRRPYFIFENNFEITFYLNCFATLFFIYGQRKIIDFILVVLVIILAGSRSGLLAFLALGVFYFFSVGWRQKIIATLLGVGAVFYIGKGRNISAPLNSIDRVQSLQALLGHYNNSFWEILKDPLGAGIYQKFPGYLCSRIPDFAEWFTGNSHNCDPLMLQAFYTRALFQFGIYITVLIPILFFYLIKKEINAKLALIILTPMACVATSVGGFSNGLAFWGVLLSVYAYQQYQNPNLLLHASSGKR
jgi:hypothetical protein